MASTSSYHHHHQHESVEAASDRTGGEQAEAAADLDLDTAADVYRYLRGHWELEKSIDYKVGGMAGSWRGVASFSPPLPLPPPPQQQRQQQEEEEEEEQQEPASAAAAADEGETINPSLLLRYLEQGTFRINGKGAGFEAGQRLVYDCGNNSGRVRVHFVDDPKQPNKLRFFHELDFRRPSTDLAAAAPIASTATAAATARAPGGSEFKGEGEGSSSGSDSKAAAAATAVDVGVRRPRAEFEHLCVRDMYRGQVEVVGPDEFKTRWHVTGPSKDGRIHAIYRRKPPGSQEEQHGGEGGEGGGGGGR